MESMRLHKKPCNHKRKDTCKCYDFDDPRWQELLKQAAMVGGWTLEQIGDVMGTSRMGICTSEKRILAKVEKHLRDRNITDKDV